MFLKAFVGLIDWLGDTLASHLSKPPEPGQVTDKEKKQHQAWAALGRCAKKDDQPQADERNRK